MSMESAGAEFSAYAENETRHNSENVLSILSGVHRVALPSLSVRRFSCTQLSSVPEIAPELMAEHELLFILDGELTCIIGGESYTATAGDALYVAPGELRCRPDSKRPAAFMTICFWDDRTAASSAPTEFSFPHLIHYGSDADVCNTVEYLRRICEHETPDQRKKCLAALQLLLVQLDDFLLRYSQNEYVTAMKRYLLDHYREGVQLADLADHVGLHPVYCAKIFKLAEGITVGAFINQLRITRAAAQLECAVETSDVAEDLGLSEFYFSRWFRQMTGISPTEYRDTLRAGYHRG
ncbi:MAG: AraC family transcriptional regulator [Clostridia bacterium]|nr:AraC family transcriptional regulator [Clostridia bacterium]